MADATQQRQDEARELLRGAVDLHVHTSPDVFKRKSTDIETVAAARDAGLGAMILKSHHTLTADRAATAREVTGFPTFGGLVLNHYVGGLNYQALETALLMGAKEVWMPTVSSKKFLSRPRGGHLGEAAKGLPEGLGIFQDGDGAIRPEIEPLLELIAKHDVVLGTGHLDPVESIALVKAARAAGISRILVTHPQAHFLEMSRAQMRELADLGATLEMDYVVYTQLQSDPVPIAEFAGLIREIGADRCVLSTDGGQPGNPPPLQMYQEMIAGLLGEGITPAEIRRMAVENPSALLNL